MLCCFFVLVSVLDMGLFGNKVLGLGLVFCVCVLYLCGVV